MRRPRRSAPDLAPALAGALLAAALGAACRDHHGPTERRVPTDTGRDLPVRTSGIAAGPAPRTAELANPYEGNVHALREGERLYGWYNCAGCHGAIGGGGMGPSLRDADWIYGASSAHIVQSIVSGRPEGMPSFAGRLSEDALWKLAAFVRSLGESPETDDPAGGLAAPEPPRRAQPQDEERHEPQEGG